MKRKLFKFCGDALLFLAGVAILLAGVAGLGLLVRVVFKIFLLGFNIL